MAVLDNLSLPAAQTGLSPAKPASSWGFGDWVVAGTPTSDIYVRSVTLQCTIKPALDTTHQILLEVGTGGTGSETVRLQVPFSVRKDTAVGYLFSSLLTFHLPEPMLVSQGVQLSVRVTDSLATATTYNGVKIGYTEGGKQLTLPLFNNSNTLFNHTIAPQAVSITAPLLSDGDTLHAPTLVVVTVLTTPLLTNSSTLYEPTVVPQAVTITAPLLSDGDTLYEPTVIPQAVSIVAPPLTNSSVLYEPVVVPQAVTVTAPLLTNDNTFYNHAVVPQAVSVEAPLITNTSQLYEPTVVPGAVTLGLSFIDTEGQLFTPIEIQAEGYVVLPAITNESQLYPPELEVIYTQTVSGGSYTQDTANKTRERILRDDDELFTIIKLFIRCQN